MRAVDLIRKKRDGGELTSDEVAWLIAAYTREEVGDDQMAAFAMAVFFRGMCAAELAALTDAMMRSGTVLSLTSVPGVKVDKHSTGGVGDKVSICLAPLVAACGVPVPMISGRALGHTGGTLDKLAAIPGFNVNVDDARFVELVHEQQCALIGQTATLAPADRRLYALRDVTATVESIPLISASIMCKKLAEGIDGLVLDVKVGSGAFMKDLAAARTLARTMIGIGDQMGRRVRALLTNMDVVLGCAVGNANETWEAIEVLRGGGPEDVVTLTIELGAEMLLLGGAAESLGEGRSKIRRAIETGRGLERLRQIIEAQGGDPRVVDDRGVMPVARHQFELTADRDGVVGQADVEAIGRSAMQLGAGRARADDPIDLAVGLMMRVRPGDHVVRGQPMVRVEYNDAARLQDTLPGLRAALPIGDEPPPVQPLIFERLP